MKMKSLSLLRQQVSSGYADGYVGEYKESPLYKQFFRHFKKEFTELATSFGCTDVQFSKSNYFDMSGFYTMPNGQMAYIHFEDWRWGAGFYTRTVKHYKDYHGGSNVFLTFDSDEEFVNQFKRFIVGYDKRMEQPKAVTKTEPSEEKIMMSILAELKPAKIA